MTSSDVAECVARHGFATGAARAVQHELLDTSDGRLHRAGWRLAVRSSGRADRTLLLTAIDDPRRTNHAATLTTTRPPATADDVARGALREQLVAVIGDRPLISVLTVRERAMTAIGDGRRAATATTLTMHDEVFVLTSGLAPIAVDAFITVDTPIDRPRRIERTRALLIDLGLGVAATDVFAHVAAAAGVDLRGNGFGDPVELDASMAAIDGYSAVLMRLADVIEVNGRLIAANPAEPAHTDHASFAEQSALKNMRVALRRTRTILDHAGGVLAKPTRARFADEFAWLADATGALRDLDVLTARVAAWSIPDAALHALTERRRAARAELITTLVSPRARALISDWRAALAARPGGGRAEEPLGRVVAKRLSRAHHRVVRDGRRIDADSPADDLHTLRKRTKALRYLTEGFGGLVPSSTRKPFVRPLKRLQDNLGEHQDADVLIGQLRAIVATLARDASTDAITHAIDAAAERQAHARAEFRQQFEAFDSAATREALRAVRRAMRG